MKIFLILLLTAGLWSFDGEINTMRDNGVKISFSTKKNSLKPIPRGMLGGEFIKAKQLDFNGMNLSNNLPDFLIKMRNLKMLNLDGVDINLGELEKIKGLTINILNLNNNPNLFKNGGNLIPIISKLGLTKLYLSNTGGKVSNYLSIGTSLPELTVLDLSDNRLKSLEKLYLENLSGLKILNLSNNSLSSFNTKHLPKDTLQKLDLSNTSFSSFNYTGDFPSLLSLDLSGNYSVEMDKKYKSEMMLSKATIIPNSLKPPFNSKKDNVNSIEPYDNIFDESLVQNKENITVIGDLMWQDKYYTEEEKYAAKVLLPQTFKGLAIDKKHYGEDYHKEYCQELSYAGYTDWRKSKASEDRILSKNSHRLNLIDVNMDNLIDTIWETAVPQNYRKKIIEDKSLALEFKNELKKKLKKDGEYDKMVNLLRVHFIFDNSKNKLYIRCVRDNN